MAKGKASGNTARKRSGEQTGRIEAPRQQSARQTARRSEADERVAALRREIAEKIAEGRRLRRAIEQRIDRALKER